MYTSSPIEIDSLPRVINIVNSFKIVIGSSPTYMTYLGFYWALTDLTIELESSLNSLPELESSLNSLPEPSSYYLDSSGGLEFSEEHSSSSLALLISLFLWVYGSSINSSSWKTCKSSSWGALSSYLFLIFGILFPF